MIVHAPARALFEYCDLDDRLSAVPKTARVRGLYFKNIRSVLERAGLNAPHEEAYPGRYSATGWYPLSEYLEQLAVAGALLSGPAQVLLGMREVGRRNVTAFAESLLGRVTIFSLSRDPVRLIQQGAAARRLSCDYGKWEFEILGPGRAVMTMHDEYIWIDSHLEGAAEGAFESIGRRVSVTTEMEAPYRGRHILTWD